MKTEYFYLIIIGIIGYLFYKKTSGTATTKTETSSSGNVSSSAVPFTGTLQTLGTVSTTPKASAVAYTPIQQQILASTVIPSSDDSEVQTEHINTPISEVSIPSEMNTPIIGSTLSTGAIIGLTQEQVLNDVNRYAPAGDSRNINVNEFGKPVTPSVVTVEPWRDSGNADRTGLTNENPWKAEPHEGYPNGKRWIDGHWSPS
jgi:hypothetical protein